MSEFLDPYNGAFSPYWHRHARRISKHRGGWSSHVVNGGECLRFKALARRRAVRKANR